MDWNPIIRDAARRAGHSLDPEVIEELASHAKAATDAACARGASLDEARGQVRVLVDRWIEHAPALKRPPNPQAMPAPPPPTASPLAGLLHDLRYACRLLARQRGFAVVAVLTMALAIGVTTTLFSVVYGVLLRPLPWPQPERLVRLAETHAGSTRQMPWTVTADAYQPWATPSTTIDGAGAWLRSTATVGGVNGTPGSDRVSIATVTPSMFPLLQASPLVGQVFTRADRNEVVLSYGFWQERFGGDSATIGKTFTIDGRAMTVIGVMPSTFLFPDPDTRLWRPLKVTPIFSDESNHSIQAFSAMARLRPGVSPAQAAAEATAVARGVPNLNRIALALFGSSGAVNISATPVLDAMAGNFKPGLIAMFAAVVLLLLTAIANIASLQLARATTRWRELAIRAAIGAPTARLVRQLIVENVVLAAIGAAFGLALSAAIHRVLPTLLPSDFPRIDAIRLGAPVVIFAIAIAGLAGIALGALPAWQLRRVRLVDGLLDDSTGVIGARRGGGRTWIMAAQVAIACALLVGGGLLMRSLQAMASVDRGFAAPNVLTARLGLPDYAFTKDTRTAALETFLAQANALPGQPAVALTTGLPLTGSENLTGFTMPSPRPSVGEVDVHAVRSVVTPGYFAAIGMRLAHGRLFTDAENTATAAKVVVVNRTFARQYLTDRAVGDRISGFMQDDGLGFEVVGIVDDTIRRGLTDVAQPEIFSLLRQSGAPAANQDVVLRSSANPAVLAAPLRALVARLSPEATLGSVRTMDDRVSDSLARPRLYAVVLAVFALSALAIAAVGLTGVLSFIVAQRTREIALRAALGAAPRQIFALVFGRGMLATFAGVAAGLGVALASVRSLGSLLYGISSHDTATFVLAPAAIVLIAAVACAVPAARALRVNPLTALRG